MGMAEGLGALSAVAYYSGDQGEAKRLCLETKLLHEQLRNSVMATVSLSNAGHVCTELEECQTAAQHLYTQRSKRARLAVANVTRKANPSVITTLRLA